VLPAAVEKLACPVCHIALAQQGPALKCQSGHSFDIAKQGYVNLLGPRSPNTGDSTDMVASRMRLLETGLLADVAAGTSRAVAQTADVSTILDVGAGTGYYLGAALRAVPGSIGIGLDLSVPAAKAAARAHPCAVAVVADTWSRLPIASGAVDVVLNVFAPRNAAEMKRVLRPDGRLVVVTPNTDHLLELVTTLDLITVDSEKDRRLADQLGGDFDQVDSESLRCTQPVTADAVVDLIAMGPTGARRSLAQIRADVWAATLSEAVTISVRIGVFAPRTGTEQRS